MNRNVRAAYWALCCAAAGISFSADAQVPDVPKETGRVHMALQMSKNAFMYRFCLRIVAEGSKTSQVACYPKVFLPIGTFPPKATSEASDETMEGALYAFDMPVGDYKIVSFFVINARANAEYGPKTNFSVPFTVAKDKEIYLGAWTANGIHFDKSWLGAPYSTGAYLTLEDQFARDEPRFSRLNHPTNAALVEDRSPDPVQINHLLIRSKPVLAAADQAPPLAPPKPPVSGSRESGADVPKESGTIDQVPNAQDVLK